MMESPLKKPHFQAFQAGSPFTTPYNYNSGKGKQE